MGEHRRALISVGVGDFTNTSSGPYRELAIAFPACEASEPLELGCNTFSACQSQLPDCAHTYMFQSVVSHEAALWLARGMGVDARLAPKFSFGRPSKDNVLSFSVRGPGGTEA